MDENRFDAMTRSLSGVRTRRHVVGGLAVFAMIRGVAFPAAAARKKGRKKPRLNQFGCIDVGRSASARTGAAARASARGRRRPAGAWRTTRATAPRTTTPARNLSTAGRLDVAIEPRAKPGSAPMPSSAIAPRARKIRTARHSLGPARPASSARRTASGSTAAGGARPASPPPRWLVRPTPARSPWTHGPVPIANDRSRARMGRGKQGEAHERPHR